MTITERPRSTLGTLSAADADAARSAAANHEMAGSFMRSSMVAPVRSLYGDAEDFDGSEIFESNTHIEVGVAELAACVAALIEGTVGVRAVGVLVPGLEAPMARRPPWQLLTEPIFVEREPAATVAIVW
jgi:hypothetical protein